LIVHRSLGGTGTTASRRSIPVISLNETFRLPSAFQCSRLPINASRSFWSAISGGENALNVFSVSFA
jgi:hypothetical protein